MAVRVREQSPGLYVWVLTQPSGHDGDADVCLVASDHPYVSSEAAMRLGAACLKVLEARAVRSPEQAC
jgi:hypothetical protein